VKLTVTLTFDVRDDTPPSFARVLAESLASHGVWEHAVDAGGYVDLDRVPWSAVLAKSRDLRAGEWRGGS
jgi:hypothetical protein